MTAPTNVLFLCTANSARSVIAEAILNRRGNSRFHAYSAGSQPRGSINPNTLALLERHGYDTKGLRSKSWQEFAAPGAPPVGLVVTVCDNAAGEACPVWPGQPLSAHWGIADPAAVTEPPEAVAAAFEEAHRLLHLRIDALLALPWEALDRPALLARLRDIGRGEGATRTAGAQT